MKISIKNYQLLLYHLIGFHLCCRQKDRWSFMLVVVRKLNETTLKLSSDAFEESSKTIQEAIKYLGKIITWKLFETSFFNET